MNIPIWTWGAAQSKVKQAELELQQAKNDLSLTQRKLLANWIVFTWRRRWPTRRSLPCASSLKLSAENLRSDAAALQAGEATALEVVDAQTTLVQARNAFDDGLVRYRLALANLQTLTGAF